MEIISIHSLRMEGDRLVDGFRQTIEGFQSTPSAWRETRSHCTSSIMPGYFNPLPPHGGRRYQDIMYDRNRNISIHSLRMEGDSTKRKQQELDRKISIHSLRMEGDGSKLTVSTP